MEAKFDSRIAEFSAKGKETVEAHSSIVRSYIENQTKIRIALYIVSCVFILVAAGLVVFAPDGREVLTAIISLALFAIAVGIAGFSFFKVKTPLIQAEAGGETTGVQRDDRSPAIVEGDEDSDGRLEGH